MITFDENGLGQDMNQEIIKDNTDIFNNGKRISIFLVPCIVCMIIVCFLCRGIIETYPRFGGRCVLFALCTLVFWFVLFILHQKKMNNDKNRGLCIKCSLFPVVIIGTFIGFFLAYVSWGSGYLTLMPYEQIDNNGAHIDSMFHSSIAEGWLHRGYPSTMLNDERYLSYHTFSHLLFAIISGIIHIPAFTAYNFLYPVIFMPLYCFSIMFAVTMAKKYFAGGSYVQFLDLIVIGLFVFGVTDNIDAYGVKKNSFLISESFLIANTLSLLFCGITFGSMKNCGGKKTQVLYYSIIVPLEIFIISWSKISTGFIFTVAAMYLVFRCGIKNKIIWILDIIYLTVFAICLKLYGSYVSGGYHSTLLSLIGILPLRHTMGAGLRWYAGHYLILSLMTILFIFFEIKNNKFSWKDIREGKTIWIECIILMSLMAFAPSALLNVGYSDAVYFSFCIEIPSLVLLCGHDYIDIDKDAKGLLKPLVYAVSLGWCLWMGYHHKPDNPISLITNEHESNLSDIFFEIRDAVGDKPEDYTIFIEPDSFVSKVYPEGKKTIFVCTAMTGVSVMNATYTEGGRYYAYNGDVVERYGMDDVSNGKITYDDAADIAKSRGKKHIIHLEKSEYEIIDLEQ
ncbi:MAG: hypothetical protein K5987_08165 [Lachnospiraceae bacterium]|nr:hypothetical protein [Lachnospiraceae bacterium]